MLTTFPTGLPHLRRATSGLHAETGAACAPTIPAVDPAVQRFIDAHRQQGYRYAELDPTGASRPMDIDDLGRQAVLVDPTGARVGVWQAGTFPGFTVLGEVGAPS